MITHIKSYHLQPFEEAVGNLHNLRVDDPFVVAVIGPVEVLLPMEMEEALSHLIGKRIGVIRTDSDYRMRVFSDFSGET